MTHAANNAKSIFLLSIPFLLFICVLFVARSSQFIEHSQSLSTYLILDLLLTIPLIYFLIVRRTKIPNTTVIPVVFIGLITGYYALPIEEHYYLDIFRKFGVPVIELSVLAFVIWKVRKAIQVFRSNNNPDSDFYTVLRRTCREIVQGRMADFLVSEISVLYYGFLNWKKPHLGENHFTYHKKSGSPALFGALIFIIFVETIAVHLILLQWSYWAALILSILSVYTGFQLLGFGRSLSQRPIILDEDRLVLRYGILNESVIKIKEIESLELTRKTLKFDNEVRKFSLLGELESHNVVIKCRLPQVMKGIYGITKSYSTLALHVDEKERFVEEVRRIIEN